MWTTCKSGSKDDCDIIFLYRGNLFFDEVEEVDGGEPEKEDEWLLTQEDYDREKEDEALEREGELELEQDQIEQDVEVDVEGVEEEKSGEIKKTDKPESVEKKDMDGHDPKLYNQYKYHSTPTLGLLGRRKGKK